MGVSITATNSEYDFYMGYGGFFNLRKNVALALDREFGENYALLSRCVTPRQFEENDAVANALITEKNLDEDVVEFLYASDCGGSVSHKTCRKIYDLIKDVDFGDKGFRYAAYRKDDYEDFKKFLLQCWSKRRRMRWE